ncbi:MAG: HmuY family protein [Bacteroidales bacterium]|nr:HmuY family protein [Bacteroidales bacterium]
MKKDVMIYSLIFIDLLLLQGCFPKDKRVVPLDIDITEIPYSMYDTQAWFSLRDMAVVASNSYLDWDLGFESTGTGHHIILNYARYMHAGNTGSSDFYGITRNICDTMIYDSSNGDLNKTAIGQWADFTDPLNPVYPKNVYIIDMGADNNGTPFGLKKITFDSFENNKYSIHFSNLDGTDEHTYEVTADHERSFTLFSFKNGGSTVALQPVDSNWDICFTQYSTILFDDNNIATPYIVRGVYSNMKGTTAAHDTINSFYDITAGDIASYTFSSAQDAVGYEWKDFEDDSYKINPDIFYIIRDQLGGYYKLKFTGYYNTSGERGYPSFQCIKLSE